jgi:hypothetical protein
MKAGGFALIAYETLHTTVYIIILSYKIETMRRTCYYCIMLLLQAFILYQSTLCYIYYSKTDIVSFISRDFSIIYGKFCAEKAKITNYFILVAYSLLGFILIHYIHTVYLKLIIILFVYNMGSYNNYSFHIHFYFVVA